MQHIEIRYNRVHLVGTRGVDCILRQFPEPRAEHVSPSPDGGIVTGHRIVPGSTVHDVVHGKVVRRIQESINNG